MMSKNLPEATQQMQSDAKIRLSRIVLERDNLEAALKEKTRIDLASDLHCTQFQHPSSSLLPRTRGGSLLHTTWMPDTPALPWHFVSSVKLSHVLKRSGVDRGEVRAPALVHCTRLRPASK
jgi:hypothetical protein